MMRYDEFISENLADKLNDNPKSNAARMAKKMNLTYIGFGRYADAKNKLYIVKNDTLYPLKTKEEIGAGWSNLATKKETGSLQPKDAMAAQQLNQQAAISKFSEKEVAGQSKKFAGDIVKRAMALSEIYSHVQYDDTQLDAIKFYTTDGFDMINRFLYKGFDDNTDPQVAQQITSAVDALDTIFDGAEAPYDYPVYMGLNQRYDPSKIKPDSNFIFRGFVSTSIDLSKAIEGFEGGDGVILQIDIKQGQRSVYIDNFSGSPGEMETLLPRGTNITVVDNPKPFSPTFLGMDSGNIVLIRCVINQQ